MSGRQVKVINEQAARYGLPFGGPTIIDLSEVVRALHDFLAKNSQKLASDDDSMMRGGPSPALERYREERAKLALLDRLERQRALVPLQEILRDLDRMATILRRSAELLQRRFGQEALDIYMGAIEEFERSVEEDFQQEVDDPSLMSEAARAVEME